MEQNLDIIVGVVEFEYSNRWSLTAPIVFQDRTCYLETNECVATLIFWSQLFLV